ncbi:hypothetical protein E1180_14275 [Roseibium denhamense]|uniref:Uncharacterized protein n=1 Tax=Roseibium denhamense TaxID=76305 RepID=A0ABY1NEA5_9HYPH|nr:hypothetical protein [Roseibium denhamense]MTI06683.1 hypothetical protein [Roseibium denhamense]SMP06839.1 hypothetical protein SAMN06265374_0808 [Roseibium denhamense]
MRAVSTELSDSLNAFHEDFLEAGKSGTPLPARQMLVLARSFAILFRLAKNLEAELAIHSVDFHRELTRYFHRELALTHICCCLKTGFC